MTEPKRKARAQATSAEGPFTLWARGNVKAARRSAQELLAGELSEPDRARLERLLVDTAPDARAWRIAAFAVAVLVFVLLLTKALN
jgi:hypothetical protein